MEVSLADIKRFQEADTNLMLHRAPHPVFRLKLRNDWFIVRVKWNLMSALRVCGGVGRDSEVKVATQ